MTKMVIVVRRDLNMRKGKMIAQAGHAVLDVILNRGVIENGVMCIPFHDLDTWFYDGLSTKVCLSVNSEAELFIIFNNAKEANLPVALVKDVGKTEFHGESTFTCLAIGPCENQQIDKITGHLQLL